MPSTQYVFTDVQFFEPLDKTYQFTVFSRTRTQVDYDGQVDFFTAGYFNYTSKIGLGPSLVTRITAAGANADVGMHIYKQNEKLSFFGLAAFSLSESNRVSWFSIFKYQPPLSEQWKLYSSIELFTVLDKWRHAASVQRLRLGLSANSYQFGLGANLLLLGEGLSFFNNSYGVFIRKEF